MNKILILFVHVFYHTWDSNEVTEAIDSHPAIRPVSYNQEKLLEVSSTYIVFLAFQ